jgi:maleate isomerase
MGMTSGVEPAALLMKDASPNLLVFHCTAVSTWDTEMDAELCVRMKASTGIKSITTGRALVEALRAVDARNVVLLTPYIDEINEREVAFLNRHDISVVALRGLGLRTPDQMASVSPSNWFDLALTHQRDTVDAYVISCTAIRTLPVIEEIEAVTKRPVITSNQAMAWYALRQCGIDDRVEGAGALFSHRLHRT